MNRSASIRTAAFPRRRGQVWFTDLAVSAVIFAVVCALAATIIAQLVREDEFEDVRGQASMLGELLVREGYPPHWTSDDVVKIGLFAEDRLSLRKLREAAAMTPDALRRASRVRDDMYIYLTDDMNTTVPIAGVCGLGDLAVTGVPNTTRLVALAYPGSSSPVVDGLGTAVTLATSSYNRTPEVVIVEGAAFNATNVAAASLLFDRWARNGVLFFVIGDPGAPILGVMVNSTAVTSLSVQGDAGAAVGLPADSSIDVVGTIPTLEEPSAPDIQGYVPVALASSGKVGIATWRYHDADVWYFATSDGLFDDGVPVVERITNATLSSINVAWPSCPSPSFPAAEQIVVYDRAVRYRDGMVFMHSIVWRGS